MRLPGSIENNIAKDKNAENVPYLELTEVVLAHCNIVNNNYLQDSRNVSRVVPNNSLGKLIKICLFRIKIEMK